jgi:hypothetical protein
METDAPDRTALARLNAMKFAHPGATSTHPNK